MCDPLVTVAVAVAVAVAVGVASEMKVPRLFFLVQYVLLVIAAVFDDMDDHGRPQSNVPTKPFHHKGTNDATPWQEDGHVQMNSVAT